MTLAIDLDRRARDIARSLWAGESAPRLIPELLELARLSSYPSFAWRFSHRELALQLAACEPWRGSLLARRLLEGFPEDHAAWAALGLAQSLLGHSRFAIRCYERALRLSPGQPRYAHNLGHLYDVALGQPERALPLLEAAYRHEPRNQDVAASYAHALARSGSVARAEALLRRALAGGATREQAELLVWVASLVDSEAVDSEAVDSERTESEFSESPRRSEPPPAPRGGRARRGRARGGRTHPVR